MVGQVSDVRLDVVPTDFRRVGRKVVSVSNRVCWFATVRYFSIVRGERFAALSDGRTA